MANAEINPVPVWTLSTREAAAPPIPLDGVMTATRVSELRSALASYLDVPIATLEAHPLPSVIDRRVGVELSAASPLAQNLSLLVSSSKSAPSVAQSGETLYRMVVPSKVAQEFGAGAVKSMIAKGVPGGIRGPLVGPGGIKAAAAFVPATGAGAAGASAAGGAAVAAGALTVAAPIVLMVVAAGISAYAEHERQKTMDSIVGLLEELRDQALSNEYASLNGSRPSIDKAIALLLDREQIGAAQGIGPAVYAIDVALAEAEGRLRKWQAGLEELRNGRVDIASVEKHFPGVSRDGGLFRAHVELAALAIALKKRVITIQAVEQAQSSPENLFENFAQVLNQDQEQIVAMERQIAEVLVGLSKLHLDRAHGVKGVIFTPAEVDKLLAAGHRLREIGDGISLEDRPNDVAIDMIRREDGSLLVLPASEA